MAAFSPNKRVPVPLGPQRPLLLFDVVPGYSPIKVRTRI